MKKTITASELENRLDEVIEKMAEFIEATDERLLAIEKRKEKLEEVIEVLQASHKEKKEKTEEEVILESLKYCVHRIKKHEGCGIFKALNKKDRSKLYEIIREYEISVNFMRANPR